MEDIIENLEDRDDVCKTTYSNVKINEMRRVETEMWHDTDGLHALFLMAKDGDLSQAGLMDKARERALAVRETDIDGITYLKGADLSCGDYTYNITDSE